MKKKFFTLLSLVLSAAFSLSGCNMYLELSVNNAWCGEKDPLTGYVEELTYSVNFDKSLMDEGIKNDTDLSIEIGTGTYVSTLEVLSGFPSTASISGKEIKSDIIDGLNANEKQAYHLTTTLTIPVKYSYPWLDDENKEITKVFEQVDVIESEIYFCNRQLSYAPVYSYQKANYTILNYGTNIKLPRVYQTLSEVSYNKSNYTVNYSYGKEEGKEGYAVNNKTTNNYSFKTITDNAMLFFMIRNSVIEKDNTIGIPTVSANYQKDELLAVGNANTQEIEVNITSNLGDMVGKMAVNEIRFALNDQSASGTTQKVFIQNKVENSTIPYRSLMVRYEEPLTAYGAYVPLGKLIYTLVEANFTE